MLTNFFFGSLVIGYLMNLWFHTDFLEEYLKAFRIQKVNKRFAKFLSLKEMGDSMNFLQYILLYHNCFITRLLSCFKCFITATSIIYSFGLAEYTDNPLYLLAWPVLSYFSVVSYRVMEFFFNDGIRTTH
jgi:hypothetical protein